MPASRCCIFGCSSRRVKTAIVRCRSRYSSMSRLMNLVVLRCGGLLVERGQPLDDAGDGLVEAPHRELAGDARHLDRHVVDVVAGEQLARALQAAVGLALAEHGLAEEVDVEAHAVGAQVGERLVEVLRRRVDDQVADHLAQHPAGDRDDDPRAAGSRTRRRRRSRIAGTRAGSAGSCGRPARGSCAATRRSSGRMTPSTNPSVNSRPRGSLSTPARRSALGSGLAVSLWVSHCRTRVSTSSTVGRSAMAFSGGTHGTQSAPSRRISKSDVSRTVSFGVDTKDAP